MMVKKTCYELVFSIPPYSELIPQVPVLKWWLKLLLTWPKVTWNTCYPLNRGSSTEPGSPGRVAGENQTKTPDQNVCRLEGLKNPGFEPGLLKHRWPNWGLEQWIVQICSQICNPELWTSRGQSLRGHLHLQRCCKMQANQHRTYEKLWSIFTYWWNEGTELTNTAGLWSVPLDHLQSLIKLARQAFQR